ncbi:hypothetical protein Daus18300_012258 [Diaporthe australafricana]|uniref:DUF7708 domain-containing protein n=1 Tax=Diaporthe australafricana TaxID=127596 RepID=A0ABR3W3D7_9PEZI
MGEAPSSKQFYLTQIRQAFFFGGLHCPLEEVGEKDPEDASREHEKFKKRLSHVLKGSLGLARNKKELKQCFQKAGEQQGDSVELGKLAAAEFSDATGRLEMFKQSRTRGIRGANATLQDSLFAVARFAAAYSNVLEAVSKTAGPYTEIGYQTMTVLLIVFVNKKRHDDKVEGHLDQIQKILPRLEAWKGIYPNEEMEKLVSKTYHLVIQFSRSAVEYFCRRWKRVRMAVNPFSMSSNFDEVAQRIYATLAEVNAEANQRLHASSKIIERTVLELRDSNAALKMQLDDRDKQDDEEKFETLEEELSGTTEGLPKVYPVNIPSIFARIFSNMVPGFILFIPVPVVIFTEASISDAISSALEQARLFLSEVLTEISKREAHPTSDKDQKRTTAYIVLDRLDCIGDEVQLKKLLRELAYLTAEKDAFCVKVVAVAEARLQEHNWKDSLPQDLVDPDQVFEVKMDQRELSSKEMVKEKRQLLWED